MTTTIDQATKDRIGPALGKVASGVYIVTTEDDTGRDGMLATWINQLSFSPPLVSVAIHRDRPITARFHAGTRFVVNVLAQSNSDIFKNFAKPFKEGLDRFEGLEMLDDFEGGPAFKDCISVLACEVIEIIEPGDHRLVVGRILDARILDAELKPMVHIRKSGFDY
ncbi:MAG: flavin reductase family protein [Cyanobacteria bacterium]|nr:flavin reductase family protein [Cyanobacteriota bacterium]